MAVFPDRIVLKHSTDNASYITAAMNPLTGVDPAAPGEIVIKRESGAVKLYSLDSNNNPIQVTGAIKNENKGSLTVSNFGEGSSSFILNDGAVTDSKLAASSVTSAKISGTIGINKGGTGQSTANAGLNALLPSQTGNSGKALVSNGTNTSWSKPTYVIDELTDVNTSTSAPVNLQSLKWDSSTSNWIPKEDLSIEPPITPTSPCRVGQIAHDDDYIYACIATNQWARAPLSSWDGSQIYVPTQTGSITTHKPTDIGPSADPYIDNVLLLLNCNGVNGGTSFVDSSPYARTVTRAAFDVSPTATTSTSVKKYGSASVLIGTGDNTQRLNVPTSSDWNFGSGDFTFEIWAYVTAYINGNPGNVQGLMGRGDTPQASPSFFFGLQMGNGTSFQRGIHFYVGTGGGTSNLYQSLENGSYALNTWHHVAACRSGANLRLFCNGIQVGSTHNIGTTSMYHSSFDLHVGRWYGYAGSIIGYIDDARITKGVARYTSNFTPPVEEFSGLVI